MAILYIFLMISLVLGSAPSMGDLKQIAASFTYDLKYTFYQLLLTLISIITVWVVVTTQQIPIIHESVTYLFILLGYYALKYAIKGVKGAYKRIFKRNDPTPKPLVKHRRAKRLYRYKTPKEKEAQW
jgi:hypothetical protein